jgi:hypothetical protein
MFKSKKMLLATVLALNTVGAVQVWGQAAPPAGRPAPAPGTLTTAEISRAVNMLKKAGSEPVDKDILEKYIRAELTKLTLQKEPAKDTAAYAQVRFNLINAIRVCGTDQAKSIAIKSVLLNATSLKNNNKQSMWTRVNAMLAIAELDVDSNKPAPDTYRELLATTKDPDAPLAIRAIAAYGLYRQAKFNNLPANIKQALAQDMVTLISSKPKSSIDLQAHSWLVRRGFDILTVTGSPLGQPVALEKLSDANELPSLRIASAEYLSKQDLSKMTEDNKLKYFFGAMQLIEKQLVLWHQREHGRIKAKSGAGMGSGGYGGDMGGGKGMGMGMGMEMGSGDSGYGESGGMSDYGGMDGMGSDGGSAGSGYAGGMGGGNNSQPKVKPLEVQPWDVRLARRLANHYAQVAHQALDGKSMKNAKGAAAAVNKGIVPSLPADLQEHSKELIEAVEQLQIRLNSNSAASKLKTMTTLLNQVEEPIERIMDTLRKIPAFKEMYPEYKDGEELQSIEEPKPDEPTAPKGEGDNNEGEKADEAKPDAKPEGDKAAASPDK